MSKRRGPPPDGNHPVPNSESHPATRLKFVCVEYDGDSDRCTIYPRESDRAELTTTWLTADRGAFVDLAAFE